MTVSGTPAEKIELIQRLRWLIQLRWLFGAGLLLLGLSQPWLPLGEVRRTPLLAIGVGILLYNWAFWALEGWLEKHRPRIHEQQATLAAILQIILDLLALTAVLHFSGGVTNPFFTFFIFHMVIATILLCKHCVYMLAGLAIVMFAGIGVAEYKGWLPHTRLLEVENLHTSLGYVILVVLAFASALLIAVYFGTSISSKLRERNAEVLELQNQLAEHAEELEQSNAALRRADEVKTQYFRKASHELKSPLAAQQSLLQTLLVELNDLEPKSRKRIERAIERGNELLVLLNDLLTLSKSRDVARPVHHEWVDPAEKLRTVLDNLLIQADSKQIQLQEHIQDTLPVLCAEPSLLPTLAENLLSNAIKYTPEGGKVSFSLTADDKNLIMVVTDTGIGIASEDVDRIGEEFFRTRAAVDSGAQGTGLGMAIVRAMVRAMKGKLEIQSQPGQGTRISIMLPVYDPELISYCKLPDKTPAAAKKQQKPASTGSQLT